MAPREAVEDIIECHQPVGTTAAAAALSVFVPMPHPMRFEKSDKVLCQRSNGEWTHAKVHSFEPWPPEGGTLTLQVDKYRRKVLDLSKRRHLERVLPFATQRGSPSHAHARTSNGARAWGASEGRRGDEGRRGEVGW